MAQAPPCWGRGRLPAFLLSRGGEGRWTDIRREGARVAKLVITWKKSAIGYAQDQKDTIRALGLHRLNQKVEHSDNRSIRGMINKVRHLVTVEEQPEVS